MSRRCSVVFVVMVAALIAVSMGLLRSGSGTRSPDSSRDWPMALGPLDEVPKRYPARDTSTSAVRLADLASAAGVELTPSYAGTPSAHGAVDAIRPALTKYVEQQLLGVDDRVEPAPADLRAYFAAHESALGDVRAHLLGPGAIIWATDISVAEQAPLPNLGGHLALTRLVIGHALDEMAGGQSAAAADDLRAMWRLQRDLWHRPELISKMNALAGTRLVNAAVRKLPQPPAWHTEMLAIDYRRSLVAAQQTEAWILRKSLGSAVPAREGLIKSPGQILDVITQPYDEMCAGNLAAVMRRAAEELARSRDCAIDGRAFDRKVHAMLPFWNRVARTATPPLGSIWQRVARLQAELELTSRILELKRRRLAAADHAWPSSAPDLAKSACSRSSWTYARGDDGIATLRFTQRIPVPRPQLGIPLEFVGRR